ncbi:amidohydrolase family protein [Maricaulis alexandrii]|uniref:amidohydrolase family protein n=1 Tax=Maricaulis alexandrii TaxID=2570354 RepID=UPI001109BB82|nr:amidohydrolase family protein [Maricaulis alexandrii]
MTRFFATLAASTILASAPGWALQDEADAAAESDSSTTEWDVANPPLPTRAIPINVTEGTWMSLDVSPDGQTIAFDMLGDIYTMPITGGTATNISSGLPWEIQPRFSPDGSQIAFTSDRGGGDNIWIMNTDGSNARQVTQESFRLLNNPTWHPSGRYIAARKHFTTTRSAGTGEIWLYHVLGGNGVQLVERPNENFQKELGEPIFSPDGRYVYYTQNVTPGNTFIYAQDSNTELFNIRRYDMETGEIDTVVEGAGGAVRPAPSPDGRYMAFIRRDRIQSGLWIKDLQSGEERRLVEEVDQDMQETWGVTGVYPNMDWLPDSSAIVYWADGGIQSVDLASGDVTNIPFEVNDTRDVIDPPRPQVEVAPDEFSTRMPRFATASPDGSRIVFESLGVLWVADAEGSDARRLTRAEAGERREITPTWSPDGRTIAFVAWDDEELGSIRTISARGGRERTITSEPGHYANPRFSPDGDMIVFEKGSGGYLTAPEWSETTGIFRVDADGGEMVQVTDGGSLPHFAASNDRIYFTRGGNGASLVSVDLNGHEERTHVTGDLVTEYQMAPDGAHVAFRQNYDVFVMPVLPGPQSVAGGAGGSALPTVEVSGNGATYFHWNQSGDTLHWSMGPEFFTATVADFRPDPTGENDYSPPEHGVSISISATADRPTGLTAITGARIITMADDEGGVIENGTILINGNRIEAVGTDIEIPEGTRTVDASGMTITPGFIDAHAHGPQGTGDLVPEQNWSVLAHLALGVTTIHDPSSRASHIFTAGEYQRAGLLLAPRIYSTGEIVYGARAASVYAEINSYEDAQEHVFRLASQGAHSIKNYNQPRRNQRQQVVAASIEAGLEVVAEGGSNYHMDMAMVADGNTSIEHNLPTAMIYEDVLQMYSQTDVAYTPTLTVTYGGLAGDPYWRQAMNVWEHPILSQNVPPRILQAGSVRRTTAPEEDFVDDDNARTAHMLFERGVDVSIGAHGQQEGLAAHWEMWSFVRGGFSPLEALMTATVMPARHLGFDQDLGSLEAGKLADLVIMRENPLDDIGNTDEIEYVMLNGRLYEADGMQEVVTGEGGRAPYFWE